MRATTLDQVIGALNRKIVGWCHYDKTQVSTEAFSRLDNLLWHKIYRWAQRKHSQKSAQWILQKYFN